MVADRWRKDRITAVDGMLDVAKGVSEADLMAAPEVPLPTIAIGSPDLHPVPPPHPQRDEKRVEDRRRSRPYRPCGRLSSTSSLDHRLHVARIAMSRSISLQQANCQSSSRIHSISHISKRAAQALQQRSIVLNLLSEFVEWLQITYLQGGVQCETSPDVFL